MTKMVVKRQILWCPTSWLFGSKSSTRSVEAPVQTAKTFTKALDRQGTCSLKIDPAASKCFVFPHGFIFYLGGLKNHVESIYLWMSKKETQCCQCSFKMLFFCVFLHVSTVYGFSGYIIASRPNPSREELAGRVWKLSRQIVEYHKLG